MKDLNINKEAEIYAKSFTYKIVDKGLYEERKSDFISGYKTILILRKIILFPFTVIKFIISLFK